MVKLVEKFLVNMVLAIDPVFTVPRYGRTFAQLGPEIKNKISHRALALLKMRKVISELMKNGIIVE